MCVFVRLLSEAEMFTGSWHFGSLYLRCCARQICGGICLCPQFAKEFAIKRSILVHVKCSSVSLCVIQSAYLFCQVLVCTRVYLQSDLEYLYVCFNAWLLFCWSLSFVFILFLFLFSQCNGSVFVVFSHQTQTTCWDHPKMTELYQSLGKNTHTITHCLQALAPGAAYCWGINKIL